MTLFPRAELDTFAFGQMLDSAKVLTGLDQLGRLQHLQRSGYWHSLTEQSVEGSFVERVFADIFGYRTLLGPNDRDVDHELRSKLYVPLAGARSFPDFALGFFRADAYETVVTAELKGPDADLDKPQTGHYGGKTPVEQAMAAAIGANAEWCIVSNTNEVRLYRVPDTSAYESVDLRDVASPADFRRAHALFSRGSLLGRTHSDPSPLSRFHTHIAAGENMLVDASPDRVRLVQRIRPKIKGDPEYPFTKLSASLRYALGAGDDFERPRLERDRLVVERIGTDKRAWHRIAVVKSGLLVCSYALPFDEHPGAADQPIDVDPALAASLLSEMFAFGWKFFGPLANELRDILQLTFEWSLEDLSPRARASGRIKWSQPRCIKPLSCAPDVERTTFPELTWRRDGHLTREHVQKTLIGVVRELFFPFEGRDDAGRRCRLEPTDEDVAECFHSDLDVFPLAPKKS